MLQQFVVVQDCPLNPGFPLMFAFTEADPQVPVSSFSDLLMDVSSISPSDSLCHLSVSPF